MGELGLRTGSVPDPEHEPRSAVLVGGEVTGGRFALVEMVEERGAELPRHLHHWEDETLYVLEGAIDAWVAGGWVEVPAGSALFLPRGVEHALCASTERARVLVFLAPSGFEGFYREMSGIGSETERLVVTAARYGCEITGPAPERYRDSRSSPGTTHATGRDEKTE